MQLWTFRPTLRTAVFAFTVLGVSLPLPVEAAEPASESIFDGDSLAGWDGDPRFWSVRDGAITGQTTRENPTEGNTFLVWRGGKVSDFELQLEYRIEGGNSGIQYRSREVKQWVVAGYQADIDAANEWTGTLYEEKGRGVLARRGQRVVIDNQGRKKVEGPTTPEDELVAAVEREDWNRYCVTVRGNRIQQSINGLPSVDVVDHQQAKAADSGIIALQLHAGPPMRVQFRNIRLRRLPASTGRTGGVKKKVVFLAGKPSHGYGAHEHFAGCTLLARAIERGVDTLRTQVYRGDWPREPDALDDVAAVVMYCDGGQGHPVLDRLDSIDRLARSGTGIVCIHYAVEVPEGPAGRRFLDWIGGYFETGWSVNPHWEPHFASLPEHPITRGVHPFSIHDEWYYHMRFREDRQGVVPILTDVPPPATLRRPDGPHSGNPHVRAAVAEGRPQPMAWAIERAGGGRGFGFTGGHFHWNWGDPNFRRIVLNAIVWAAGEEVPANGVASPTLGWEQLEENLDSAPPADFDRDAVRKRMTGG